MHRILVVDDDASLRDALSGLLESSGYQVAKADNGQEALRLVHERPTHLVLLDLRLGDQSGLEILPELKVIRPEMSVIMISALGTIEAAVEAMRLGADNFVTKPFDPPGLLAVVEKGVESCLLRSRMMQLERISTQSGPEFIASSPGMREAVRLAEAVAGRDTTVLLHGETGSGKGLLARLIHHASPRRKKQFVHLNCAGLQKELTESELFGHEKGAFTGAIERKIGLFEAAEGGTLFLDEIGEMDFPIQAKLLEILESKKFRRIGGVAELEADVRLIAATHRDLAKNVSEGRFREDLMYRLNVFSIEVPPLRDRPEDIISIAIHFLQGFYESDRTIPEIGPKARDLLISYGWPGNVRELRNVMERAAILCPPDGCILPAHLPQLGRSSVSTGEIEGPEEQTLESMERKYLELALKEHNYNMKATATDLGISRSTLYRKVKKYDIRILERPS